MAAAKDTLYIDIEDEITAVIDKVTSAKHKIVAVVLPKHAGVFQSTVNVKLLKKAAASAKKNLVLITSDKTVLAIAASVGVHVAKSLASKPEIPKVTQQTEAIETEEVADTQATEAPIVAAAAVDTTDEAIELDNSDDAAPTSAVGKAKKKLMKIPDFSKFSVRLTLGIIALLLLITGWVFGFLILPKATITIITDTMTQPVNTTITARLGLDAVNTDENIIPSKRAQVEKTDRVTVPATGQKNIGERASGTVTLTNCVNDGEKKIIPAGTQFSSGNLSFLTTEAITLNAAYFTDGQCRSSELPPGFGTYGDVSVAAAQPGPEYNIKAGNLTSSISGIRAYGSEMTGGSSKIITVISQEDVRKAEDQLKGSSKNQALTELREQLRTQGVRPIDQTLGEGEPKVDVEPAIDAEASEVTVTMTVAYNLTGVAESDIAQLLEHEIKKAMGDTPKNIRNNGLENVEFELVDSPNEADKRLTMETVATIGPELNEQTLREQSAGKKRGEIQNDIESIEGVRSVSVDYSPAWITTTPKSANKIVIVFVEENE